MNYTEEQFNTLSQWEENFRTARDGNWARNPGRHGVTVINDALNEATGVKHRANAWCQQCILNLLKNAGKLWFEDKAEREELAKKAAIPEPPVPEPEFDPAPPTPSATKKTAKKSSTTDKKPAAKKTSAKKPKAEKTEL